jgi:small-conductance mechanosensitive channel
VSPEALALGLLSAVRGVQLAIVYILLLADRPRPLLVAYLVAGLAVTLGVGIVVVTWLHTGAPTSTETSGHLVVDLVLGILAMVWAALRLAGREPRRRRPERTRKRSTVLPEALDRRLRPPTVRVVAAAGVITNLPGLYYLAALVAILQTQPSAIDGIVQVVVYALLRFAVPIAALALVVVRPDRTLETVQGAHAWGRRNAKVLIAAAVGVVGVYLTAKALVGLLG